MNNVCDEVNTPASFLVKHGILMEYNKNLQIKELRSGINEDDFSEIAEKATKLMVVNHCSTHQIDYKGRQQLKSMLHIPTQKLLPKGQNDYE